jgi:hypothetical protein
MRSILALRSRSASRAVVLAGLTCSVHSLACVAETGSDPKADQALAAPITPSRVELLAVDWELPAGTEKYLCTRKTLTESHFANLVQAISPPGTHHVGLSINDQPDAPDGTRECDVAETFIRGLGGGATGTQARGLPDGVAVELRAGSQIMINTHLFNATELTIHGHSGIEIQPVDASTVKVLADSLVAGPTKLDVPPGRSTSIGGCTVARDARFYGIMPHMHQTGSAMKVVARSRTMGEVVLYDGPFSFDNQIIHPLDVTLRAGDYLEIACTFDNTRGETLHWGESSNDEMCQVGLGRIPAGGPSICNH